MNGRRLVGARGGAFQGLREIGDDGNCRPLVEPADRTNFYQRAAEQMAAPDPGGFAVLLISLDDFEAVNDSLGHTAAEDLLQVVAARLLATVSASDTLARLPGAEFALLLADVTRPCDAREHAQSLQELLRSPTRCAGMELTVRVSIGVRHIAPCVSLEVEELLSDASAAMSAAKRKDRRVTVFEPSMRSRRLRRLQLKEGLEHALGRGEISVHYQPYFSFTDGHPGGVEALARWHHPIHGEVDPSEFIGLAESTGQIQSLGLFVLQQACRDIAALRRQHPEYRDLTLSVNVSARQLVDDRFQHELRALLRETELPGHALMLELTETALVEDVYHVAERLADIRRTGVHLAVDDFGTRYASLSYLQRFPIDTLKVDQSFVTRVHESPYEHLLTGAIITLAKTLGLRTIAEGVEEDQHALSLSTLGCDAGQGFLFARPVPASSLPSALCSGTQRLITRVSPSPHQEVS